MRLIDADALINDIAEHITEHEEMMRDSEEHPENYPEDYKTRVLNLIAGLIAANVEVANAPTIDAEPVKHGEWIESKERSKHWYCSVCGGIHTDPETGKWRETFDYRYPFCPNCGADMRGDKHEID